MKIAIFTTILLLTAILTFAQGVAINENGEAPDPSAMLDVQSNEKGVLVPRMTEAQRNAISSPATGLLIYQTNNEPGFYFNAGTPGSPAWQGIANNDGIWQQSGDDIYRISGNVGIGTSSPDALLHAHGTGTGEGNALFTGSIKGTNPGNAPAEGPGTRMMWYPDKVAFRVGRVTGSQWNTDSIGFYSTAWGHNTQAPGIRSTAWGYGTKASGSLSTAWGENTQATGNRSTAWGQNTQTTGIRSTAWGDGTQASGSNSTAWGRHTTAPSFVETALGRFNTTYTPASSTSWNSSDRLFVIGNGSSDANRSDAFIVMKNGNTGIGTSTPLKRLTIASGTYRDHLVLFRGSVDDVFGLTPTTNAGGALEIYAADQSHSGATALMTIASGGNVGIGVTGPTQRLDVNGQLRIRGGAPGAGKVLTSDANGNASWQQTGISALSCIDIDGNAYPTIDIGNQVWMAENLRVTKYRNGNSIPNVTGNAAWSALTTGAYCWYDNNQSANAKYGALYNWYAVNDPRGLCPEGWRVPTDAEWTAFTNMLGGVNVAGGKLKAVSPLWNNPNTDATNSTGFSGLPGGSRYTFGTFYNVGSLGYWWSATEYSSSDAWYRYLRYHSGGVSGYNNAKADGFSVRCLRDN